MSSLFYGLEIAKRSIYASQTAINVIGHNVANADTEGYTRQRVVTAAIDPGNLSSRLSRVLGSAVGGGVAIQSIDQIRDRFLDQEYRRENADLGKWKKLTEQMDYLESLLNETGDKGISGSLSNFFGSLSYLSEDPSSKELRTTVQQNAINLTYAFNQYYEQLVEMQKTQNDNIKVTVDEINDYLSNIAVYNKQIFAQELSGQKANDLRDKRNLLLDQLSELVNIEYSENTDGHLIVKVNNKELLNHTSVTQLEVQPDQTGVVSGETGFYSIYYEGTLDPFEFSSGKLMAYHQLRDGNAADSVGIPRLLDNLNTLARSLAEEFNAINASGHTMPYDSNPSRTGVNFFDVPAGGYGFVTAGNFCLSADLLDSPWNIACSDQPVDLSDPNSQTGNSVRILEMVALSTRSGLANVGSFEGFFKSAVVEIATQSAHCQIRHDGQLSVMTNLDTRRQSISGVNVDEEMVNMIKMQHAYAAASRVITAVDEALDVLINRTGMVGR